VLATVRRRRHVRLDVQRRAPPENNPLIDDYVIGLLVVLVLGLYSAGRYLGVGTWWESQPLVQRYSILT
jgi:thiosulfate dehydrogenase [quinone] large subunit